MSTGDFTEALEALLGPNFRDHLSGQISLPYGPGGAGQLTFTKSGYVDGDAFAGRLFARGPGQG